MHVVSILLPDSSADVYMIRGKYISSRAIKTKLVVAVSSLLYQQKVVDGKILDTHFSSASNRAIGQGFVAEKMCRVRLHACKFNSSQ